MARRYLTAMIAVGAIFTALVASSASASAQDLGAVRFFIGGQFGYSTDDIDISSDPELPGDGIAELTSGIGGVSAGASIVQQGILLLGITGDFNWLNAFGDASASTTIFSESGDCECVIVISDTTKFGLEVDWKASIRGRAGVQVAPNTFLYATTGVAFARVTLNASESLADLADRQTLTLTGVVLGSGVETMITQNVGAFAQVLYYDFGRETVQLLDSRVRLDLDETVFQAGVNIYLN